jgi:hypothetical protein
LYGDLPSAKGTTPISGLKPAFQPKIQPRLVPVKAAVNQLQAQKPVTPAARMAPIVPRALRVQKLPLAPAASRPRPQRKLASAQSSESVPFFKRQDSSLEEQIRDEYNPARPNDYEEFCVDRERKKKEAEEGAKWSQRREVDVPRAVERPTDQKLDLHASVDDMYARRLAMSQAGGGRGVTAPSSGWVSTPKRQKQEAPPSCLVMMRNMVGKGEVDADLRGEIAEECTKFGPVLKCVVHEISSSTVSDDEAVRIFVLFGNLAAAQKASKVMDGRFFGGRIVKASYYDESVFDRGDYDVQPPY